MSDKTFLVLAMSCLALQGMVENETLKNALFVLQITFVGADIVSPLWA